MIAALITAVLVQWVLLVVLAGVVFALLRQVGLLHERLGPVGALVLPGGPKPGAVAPAFELDDIDGRRVMIGGAELSDVSTLLFFLSPTCPVCKSLMPIVLSIAADHRARLVLASDGDESAQRKMVKSLKLDAYPLVLSTELGLAYHVSKLPHAVLLGADGRIVAKGLVNNREHLESLFEAQRLGVASLQEFAAAGHSATHA